MTIMRTLLLLALSLASLARLSAQSPTVESIKARLLTYFQATEEKDWATVVDYLYPALFEEVPKEDVIQQFQDMSGNGMEFEMSGYRINTVEAPYDFESKQYAEVGYIGKMSIQFTSASYQTPEVIGQLKGNMEAVYGTDAVEYDGGTHTFHVAVDKTLFAIAEAGTDQWYFIEEDAQNPVISQLIPRAVREHFSQ